MATIEELYEKMILEAENTIDLLTKKLDELDELNKNIQDIKKLAELKNIKISDIFDNNFNRILELTIQYEQNIEDIIKIKINDLQTLILSLQSEVKKIEELNIESQFKQFDEKISTIFSIINNLQINFTQILDVLNSVKNNNNELKVYLSEIDDKLKNIEKIITIAKDDVIIKLQQNNAKNSEEIQKHLSVKINETNNILVEKSDTILSKISHLHNAIENQDNENKKRQIEIEKNILETLNNQNDYTIKKIKTNRIISIISFAIIISLLIFKILL